MTSLPVGLFSKLKAAFAISGQPVKRCLLNWRYRILARASGLPIFAVTDADRQSLELSHLEAFRQLQAHHSWADLAVYPVGGAAHPAYLGILGRILQECDVRTVIEFGAGQSSMFLSSWCKTSGGTVFTIESDAEWAKRCKNDISAPTHQVVFAPLKPNDRMELWYDTDLIYAALAGAKADLIIVDGPIGTHRRSRAGLLQVFDSIAAEEWVAIWDDIHRFGELESYVEFARQRRNKHPWCDFACCQAFRTLGLAFTPKFSSVRYFC